MKLLFFYSVGSSVATFGNYSNRPIVANNVTCNINYNDALSTCLNCSAIPSDCSNQTVAGVKCQPGNGKSSMIGNSCCLATSLLKFH